jgi:basic amino acid/polyamine antiporter, APA family
MNDNKSRLGYFDLSMIVVSLVIGMGIFKMPASAAAKSGDSTIFFGAWIVGGIIALCGALTYAEIGLRMPVIGAYYKIFSKCYHPAIGFTVNTLILVSNAASLAVVALIGSDYVSHLLFNEASGLFFNMAVAIVSVGAFFVVNLFGLRTSSRTQNVLIIIKIALAVLLIASMFKGVTIPLTADDYDKSGKVYTFRDNHWLALFLITLVPVCFTYGGYQQTINFGGEVKSKSILPRSIFTGILIVLVIYLLINVAYTQVIGYDNMKNAVAIGSFLCEVWFGPVGGKIFDALMFLSVLAYVNILLMSNPRVMYAMSEDGVLPKIFAFRQPKTGALVAGLTTFSLITIIVTFFGKGVDNILGFTMFLDSIGMSTSAATLFILRRRQINSDAANAGWNKITPYLAAFFVLSYFGIAIAVVMDNYIAALTGIGLLLVFAAVYFLFYHKKHSPAT